MGHPVSSTPGLEDKPGNSASTSSIPGWSKVAYKKKFLDPGVRLGIVSSQSNLGVGIEYKNVFHCVEGSCLNRCSNL